MWVFRSMMQTLYHQEIGPIERRMSGADCRYRNVRVLLGICILFGWQQISGTGFVLAVRNIRVNSSNLLVIHALLPGFYSTAALQAFVYYFVTTGSCDHYFQWSSHEDLIWCLLYLVTILSNVHRQTEAQTPFTGMLKRAWKQPLPCSVTPWSRVHLGKLTVTQLVKKFLAFYGTRRLITVLTRAASGPYPEPVASSPHPSPLYYLSVSPICLEWSFLSGKGKVVPVLQLNITPWRLIGGVKA
jgi:hypothetical protein